MSDHNEMVTPVRTISALAILSLLMRRGQAWLTDEPDLRELRSLCVTDHCRTQADQMIAAADDTRINRLTTSG